MKKVHFIGIGGIGMSALARYYHSSGWVVTGSDNSKSEVTEGLEKEGVLVSIGLQADNIAEGVEKIIYTIAIPEGNVELVRAKEICNNVLTYPQALGEMTNDKKVIAVCGTHGKTTTTAMTYYALKDAGLDVSMIVGSLIDVNGKKTNYIHGQSDWIIIEACEYRRSFLNYNPNIVLVTNIDNDHLDYFKDEQDIQNAFQEFVNKDSVEAVILHNSETFLNANKNVEKINADEKGNFEEIELSVPGIHNRKNAQLVVALGDFLKLDKNKVLDGLKNFKGTWRRQEYKGEFFGSTFYDDYAHHPTEIKATLQAFREKFPSKKILAIFQPHLFSRTKLLFTDFVESFKDADEVLLLPIYAAREVYDPTISSNMLAEELNKIGKKAQVVEKNDLLEVLKSTLQEGDVAITLGAGNIYDIYQELK